MKVSTIENELKQMKEEMKKKMNTSENIFEKSFSYYWYSNECKCTAATLYWSLTPVIGRATITHPVFESIAKKLDGSFFNV